MVGRIWDVKERTFISRTTLEDALIASKYAILGEKHDNLDHHHMQAQLLQAIAESGRKPVVGFEQIDVEQGPKLKAYLDINSWSAKGLGAAINWQESGWPSWSMYEPIAEVAMKNKLRIVPLNLSRADLQAVSKKGLTVLDDNLYRELKLGDPLPNKIRLPLVEELRAAHCYLVPDNGVQRLVQVQRAKDAFMANEAVRRGKKDGAVLIAGAGHGRKEWAIPHFINQLDSVGAVVSVAFFEVKNDFRTAELYVDSADPYDYIWFTPRLDDEDPCKKFSKDLKAFEKKTGLTKNPEAE